MPPKKSTKKAPKGSHVMPDGSVMKDSDMKKTDVPTASKTKAPRKTGAKPKASAGKPTGTWMAHVKKTYEAGKKKNPDYAYKSAMADAKKTYKK
tara:strand:- start:345 stop:626 length:282 start_codon:yes stop_codon:yes gene_type:complete